MKVYVMQSLRKKDMKTGEMMDAFLDKEGIDHVFYNISSEDDLESAFEEISKDIKQLNTSPYIHFDCHANDDGIGIIGSDGSEELFKWGRLRNDLRGLYLESRRKSVIAMSCCEGFNASKLVGSYNKPCPYDFICGTFEKIGFQESFDVFSEFYKQIKDGQEPYAASVEISNRKVFSNVKFIGLNSYTLFNLSIDGYIKKELTDEKIKKRKEYLLGEIKKSSGFVNEDQVKFINEILSEEGQRKMLQKHVNTFFS